MIVPFRPRYTDEVQQRLEARAAREARQQRRAEPVRPTPIGPGPVSVWFEQEERG